MEQAINGKPWGELSDSIIKQWGLIPGEYTRDHPNAILAVEGKPEFYCNYSQDRISYVVINGSTKHVFWRKK